MKKIKKNPKQYNFPFNNQDNPKSPHAGKRHSQRRHETPDLPKMVHPPDARIQPPSTLRGKKQTTAHKLRAIHWHGQLLQGSTILPW